MADKGLDRKLVLGTAEGLASELLGDACQHKLPIKTRFVVREGGDI